MTLEQLDMSRMGSQSPLMAVTRPTTGTPDDADDPADEQAGENEAPIRETDETEEAPEEFEIDDEDELGHPEDAANEADDDLGDDGLGDDGLEDDDDDDR